MYCFYFIVSILISSCPTRPVISFDESQATPSITSLSNSPCHFELVEKSILQQWQLETKIRLIGLSRGRNEKIVCIIIRDADRLGKTSVSTSKITSNCRISFYDAEEMQYLCASLSNLETDMFWCANYSFQSPSYLPCHHNPIYNLHSGMSNVAMLRMNS